MSDRPKKRSDKSRKMNRDEERARVDEKRISVVPHGLCHELDNKQILIDLINKKPVDPCRELFNFKVVPKLLTSFTPTELKDLNDIFMFFDSNNDGFIDQEEYSNIIKILSFHRSREECLKLIYRNAIMRFGCLNFIEFATSLVDIEKESDYDLMDEFICAFNEMDVDKSGFITLENLTHHCNQGNLNFSKLQLEEMIQIGDKNGDGKLNFNEFISIMENVKWFV